MKSTQGFTLIELLVVISIIALLSSVALAGLGTARNRAGDSAVKAGLRQLSTQTQMYRDTHTDFGRNVTACGSGTPTPNVFFSDAKITEILANIQQNDATGATVSCRTDAATGQFWAVSVSALKGGGTFCIDNSQGWFKAGTAQASGICS
jgi:prepilin-type N-terminal cleavage/methylation domain-containing protein